MVLIALPARAEEAQSPAPPDALQATVNTLLREPAAVDYLLKHPEAVLDALIAVRARGQIALNEKELLRDPDDLVAGNVAGDATIVEFFDYRCPYCKQLEPVLDALLREDKNLRIVYKEFPVLGDASVYATRVALAARTQGKYAAFHRAMMAAKGDIDEAFVLKVASSVGLDLGRLKEALRAPEIDRIIHANYALADALYIQGTPGIIIGTTLIPGATDIDTLRKNIAAARKGG